MTTPAEQYRIDNPRVEGTGDDALRDTLYRMFTENTGTNAMDSGGQYGRMWQRNQDKSMQDFDDAAQATLEINGPVSSQYDLCVSLSLWHHLTNVLELDDRCALFNAQPVTDWDSDTYGVSAEGEVLLVAMGLAELVKSDPFNSYNWDCHYSQIVQGVQADIDGADRDHETATDPERFEDKVWFEGLTEIIAADESVIDIDARYVLIQIHGGADVRGGYTDAKLFRIKGECDLLTEFASFELMAKSEDDSETMSLDWHCGEWLHDGQPLETSHFNIINLLTSGDAVSVQGDFFNE